MLTSSLLFSSVSIALPELSPVFLFLLEFEAGGGADVDEEEEVWKLIECDDVPAASVIVFISLCGGNDEQRKQVIIQYKLS